ncbi:O-methyltransferase [Massilia soli]|uniref:O-methyltransferase n=1 Tax=Massilia soli TaxID=2792854 RepID=UPI0027D9BE2C|nr:O-methyltransferase [Massilia soli]
MSGAGSIPYHLRQNKAIDRSLFIDLLSRINRYRNISSYSYIGFGGPFLEDFRTLHSALRIKTMISIESDKNVAERQRFNLPTSCITISNELSGDFLTRHTFDAPSIVWFDYAVPSQLGSQLAEAQSLVSKLAAGDIFKITLNASPEPLGRPRDGSDLRAFRAAEAAKRLADYGPAVLDVDDVTTRRFPNLLLHALFSACKRGVSGAPRLYVQPLTAFVYKDGQQMITATAIILDKLDKDAFLAQTRLAHWPHSSLDWVRPRSISIPDLSTKERLFIESLLPGGASTDIRNALGYYVGSDEADAEELMSNFVTYYRMSPSYSRVLG